MSFSDLAWAVPNKCMLHILLSNNNDNTDHPTTHRRGRLTAILGKYLVDDGELEKINTLFNHRILIKEIGALFVNIKRVMVLHWRVHNVFIQDTIKRQATLRFEERNAAARRSNGNDENDRIAANTALVIMHATGNSHLGNDNGPTV